MVIVLIVVVVVLALALLATLTFAWPTRRGPQRPANGSPGAESSSAIGLPPVAPGGCRRILFPFVSSALSSRALDAALRLARAEGATLVPVFLARVPMHVPITAPLPRQSEQAIVLQEAIEQRAAAYRVPVDARIERGRDSRHALRQAIAAEAYDRVVIAAATHGGPGFTAGDVAWLLDNAPGEIVVLRTADAKHMIKPPTPAHVGSTTATATDR